MTNREAIKMLKTILRTVHLGNRKFIEAVEKAISALKKQEQDGWIPVTERLPEKEGCYLVTVKYDHERRYSKIAWYSGDRWSSRADIIAWRLTPEPYTEEEE